MIVNGDLATMVASNRIRDSFSRRSEDRFENRVSCVSFRFSIRDVSELAAIFQ